MTGRTHAETYLEEFCGLTISENTIRKLCQEESPKMEEWQNNAAASHQPLRRAEGEIEFTVDGTCVNATEGWKEMRVGIFSLRMPGIFAFPWQWASRHLPKPHVSLTFAGIADKDTLCHPLLCAVLYGEQWKDYWNSAV